MTSGDVNAVIEPHGRSGLRSFRHAVGERCAGGSRPASQAKVGEDLVEHGRSWLMLGTPYSTARTEAPDPTTGTRDRSGGRPRLPGQARASVTRRECNGAVGMLAGLDAALWSSAGRRVGHCLAGRLTPISAYVDPISSKAANDASRISTLRHGVETAAVSSRGRKNRAPSIVSLQKASKSSRLSDRWPILDEFVEGEVGSGQSINVTC